jgi:pimeloyl-ACP methyl ester carboxylesterase
MSRFVDAQAALFDHYGTAATSSFVGSTHVLRAGSGDPVLMVHGGNSVAALMEPLLGRVASRFSVYAPDRPGCGLTGPYDYRGVELRSHAVAFLESVLDGLGLDRVSLVGNSMGGYWSLAFALAHPQRVGRLVLVGEPAGSARRLGLGFRVLASPLGQRIVARGPDFGRLVANPSRLLPVHREVALAAADQPGAASSWLSLVRTAVTGPLTYALRPELARLAVPTLFVWGERDRFGPPRLGQEMAALMPDASLAVVPDAGHLPWLDRPEEVGDRVTSFLSAPILSRW